MGKKFEEAKQNIEILKIEEKAQLDLYNYIVKKREDLEREWYGAADGDVLDISCVEKLIKATKRWVK